MSAIFFGTLIFVNLPRFLSIHLYFFFILQMKIVVALYAWIQTGRFPLFFGEKDHLHNGHKCKKVLPLDSNGFFTYISMSVFMSTCLSFSFEIFLSIFIFVYCYFCVSFWKSSVNPVSLSIVPYVCIRLKYLFICTFLLSFYYKYDCFLIIVFFAFLSLFVVVCFQSDLFLYIRKSFYRIHWWQISQGNIVVS